MARSWLAWLRGLDEQALAGVLWRRPVFFVPAYLAAGALSGVTLGYFGAFAVAFALPVRSVRTGPDGAPLAVLNDYTAVPILGALAGLVLGLAAGGLLALRRWRRGR